MAAQTVNAVVRNIDDAAISGLLNGETITVNNGGQLIVNSDNAVSQQSAVMGAITIDATTGGSVLFDGRDVWWIAFDASSGNVPTLGTVGVQDSTGGTSLATGEFLGIWGTFGSNAPLASGGLMPATGWVKFRSKVGDFVDNDVITLPGGATVTTTGAGQRGWLDISGTEATAITVPRLGTFQAFGDWYELGVATGVTSETFQYFTADQVPAIQVETGVGTGVYEWWLNAGTTRYAQNNRIRQDDAGKFFGCSNTGLITFALRGGVNNGQLLTAGVRLRVPNIHISNRNSATSWTTSQRSATLATRWDFLTTSSGVIEIDKVGGYWYLSFAQPYSVSLTDVATEGINISECATKPILTRVACSITLSLDVAPFTIASCFAGVDLIDCRTIKYEGENSDIGISITGCTNVTITGGRYISFGDNTAGTLTGSATSYAMTMTRVVGFTMTDVIGCGGQNGFRFTTCSNGVITNCGTFHNVSESATRTNAQYAFIIDTACNNILIEGYTIPSFALTPSLGIAQIINSYNCEVRNIGTPASPLALSTTQAITYGGNGTGHKAKKIYITGTTSPLSTINSDSIIEVESVRGDLADTNLAFNTLNLTLKSTHGANATTGATAVYGFHFYDTFTSTTAGRIVFVGNEPTTLTSAKAYVESGTARFTSTGILQLVTLGDAFVWEMDYYAIGHTALANIAPTITAVNSGNHTFEYQINTGSGWSIWKTLNATNLSGESVPAYVNEFDRGGFKLKVRATCNTTSATNSITNIRIDTVTTATEILREHPLRTPVIELTGTLSDSVLACYSSGGFLAGSGSHNVDKTQAIVPWDANYSVTSRLRKPGYAEISNSITVDDDGISIPVTQSDYSSIADTDPGALGITVTNHGASPVTWNSKDFSITITTTNDSLTAAQVANFINYNTSLLTAFNGFSGLAWPEMIIPDGSDFETKRGTLFGSAGTTLKGVRVVRNDGTTPVPGFTQFQSDDGTYYVPPTIITVGVSGLRAGSRVQIYDTTNSVEKFNAVVGGTSMSYSEAYSLNYNVRIRVMYATAVTADTFIEFTDTVTVAGLARSVTPAIDTVYVANAVDGFTVTGIAIDDAALLIESQDGTYSWASVYAYETAWLFSEAGIRDEGRFITALDNANYLLENFKIKNVSSPTAPLILTGGWGRDSVTGQTIDIIDTTGGSIFSNPDLVISYAVGSGLSPSEQTDLALIKSNTGLIPALL